MRKRLTSLIISAQYHPESSGGVVTHVNYLAESLHKLKTTQRHIIHVVTTHNKGSKKVETGGVAPNLIVHKLEGQNLHFDPTGSIPYENAVKFCMELCNSHKPNIIHVHDFESAYIATLLKAVYNIPVIFTVHKTPKEWDASEVYRDPKNFYLHALTKLDVFDIFIAPSNAYKDHLLDHGIENGKIRIIHHGIPRHYLKSLSNAKVFEKFNINDFNGKIIFCPIRLDRHKGPDIFIEAASIVLEKHHNDDLLFIIAGNGSKKYKQKLMDLVNTFGIENKILVGPPDNKPLVLSEMASLYRKSYICVLPSRREGFGQAVIEAFVFNKPIVASNVGGINELIIPEKTGLLFNRDEPERLAVQIMRLLNDKRLVKNIVKNVKIEIKLKYESSIMAKGYYDIYKECRNVQT